MEIKERLKKLSPEKRALLAKRFNIELTENKTTIPRLEKKIMALSYAQEHILLLEQLFSNLPLHNIAGVATHKGEFHLTYFYQSLSMVIERHEALRNPYC